MRFNPDTEGPDVPHRKPTIYDPSATYERGKDGHPVYGTLVKRFAEDADRARIAALAEALAGPDTTTISLTLAEFQALRGGFLRTTEADQAIYEKLVRAERRLVGRLNIILEGDDA